jgi:Bacterial membrane protein YfhO
VTDPQATLDPQHYELAYAGIDGRIYRNRRVLPRFFRVRNVVLEFRGFAYAQELIGMRDFAQSAIVKRLPVASDRMRNDLLAPRPVTAPEAAVTITHASDTDFGMRVHAPRWALIASSQPSWPGWRVEVGGKLVEPLVVNGAFLGFTVPPGDSDVRVYYFPGTFYAGLAVSIATILSCGVVRIAKGKR